MVGWLHKSTNKNKLDSILSRYCGPQQWMCEIEAENFKNIYIWNSGLLQ